MSVLKYQNDTISIVNIMVSLQNTEKEKRN